MNRLALVIFIMASATLMGVAIVAALVTGFDTLRPILVAAVLGLLAAFPVNWAVARQLD